MHVPYLLTRALAGLMLAQALMGILLSGQYRDAEPIKTTWFGNDWVTLMVAVPLLSVGLIHAGRGSVRALLLWLGLLGYAVYNYAFYLLGAALNVFFPLYVFAVVLAAITLILTLAKLDVAGIVVSFRPVTPGQVLGGGLVVVGIGLASVWIAMWAAYVFAGRPTPVEPEMFKLVAALDLSLMVPALMGGGLLLWRGSAWGYVIAAIASIQASVYLLVLSVNSILLIQRGLTSALGELPIWGALTVFTSVIAFVLLWNVRGDRITM